MKDKTDLNIMTGWKKPPINTNRKYPEGDWRKMCSQAAGYYLKLKEQVIQGEIVIFKLFETIFRPCWLTVEE